HTTFQRGSLITLRIHPLSVRFQTGESVIVQAIRQIQRIAFDGEFAIKGNTLNLANGLNDNGFARLKANGEWVNAQGNERTSLKGSM
ncbi:hypothetical protein AIZ15_24580, partial [Salmonella enterica subsp. enterica serovar Typhimurium]|uniref:hypothetical protein n=1 Tax=Salmonella enterica TaxID=28901 RepID=UPI0007920445